MSLTLLKHWPDGSFEQEQVQAEGRVLVEPCKTHAELVAAVRSGCDILLANGEIPLDAEVFTASDRLQRVICYDVGPLKWVDLEAATKNGVVVEFPRTLCQNAVAEYTLTLALALARHLMPGAAMGRAGGWLLRGRESLRGFELQGKVWGVVGLGRIGRLVAEKATALGMRVVAHDPYVQSTESPWPVVALPQLLREADIISLHVRVGPENHGMIAEHELRSMKPTALLVNTGRGVLIDEAALGRALKERWIAGAALDVVCVEPPPPDYPLLQLDNAIITPHMAWSTLEVRELERQDLAEELRRAVRLQEPLHCANPEVIRKTKGGEAKTQDGNG